jgi:D-alanyl-D-alanine carboxypeptidase
VLPWLLELPPLRWIGLRSYGIYLWHWPIFMVTRPGVDVHEDGWQLQALRFALALALAALSYTFVERPIREGAIGRLWHTLRRRATPPADASAPAHSTQASGFLRRLTRRPRRWHRRWGPAIATGVLALGAAYITTNMAHAALDGTLLDPGSATSALPRTTGTAQGTAQAAGEPSAAATPAPTAGPTAQAEQTATPAPPAAAEPTFDPALAEQLQRLLDDTVADGTIPGAVLSVRLPDGTTWTGASGVADRDAGTPIQPDTRVRIGSLSKMFTAVVALQLIEEGKIDLEAPISTWLPGMVPNGEKITIRQLLQHTSGLYDYLEDRRFLRRAYEDPQRNWTPEELVEYAVDFPPSFAPGSKGNWDYSNTNYVLLGMIIERVTGNSLDQELRRRIFEPLDLRATYVVPAEKVQGPQARGYSKSDDHTEVAMSFTFGSANIVTTMDDLRTFGMALFAGDLLDDSAREQMQQFVNGKGKYDMPDLEYGLGLMGNQLPIAAGEAGEVRKQRVVGHIGGFGGFRAATWYAPEDGTLVALAVNQSSTDPNDLATQVFGAILARQRS